MLYCSLAKVERLEVKKKILSRIDCLVKTLSTKLDRTIRKPYGITTWTPITAYKLVEYLVDIHLMLYKIIHVHFMVFKHDIFFVCNLLVVRFAASCKMRT